MVNYTWQFFHAKYTVQVRVARALIYNLTKYNVSTWAESDIFFVSQLSHKSATDDLLYTLIMYKR